MVKPRSYLLFLLALAASGPDVAASFGFATCASTVAGTARVAIGDGWLGVSLTEGDDGRPRIVEVVPESPAEKAGLQADDVFLSVDGVATPDLDALIGQLQSKDNGDRVRFQVRRGADTVEISVTLAERPIDDADPPTPAAAGKTPPGPAPAATGKAYAGVALEDSDAGVRVVRVLPESPAAAAGLLAGDLLRAVDGRQIGDIDALDGMLQRARPGQRVAVRVRRTAADLRLELTLGAAPAAMAATTAVPPPELPPGVFATDPMQALASARQAGRPVLLVFGATWCAACHAQRRTLTDAGLAPSLAGYDTIWVDAERHGKLADEYGVQGLPHLFVLAGDGKPRVSREGYQPAANVIAMLAAALPDVEPAPPLVDAAAVDRIGSLRHEVRELRREVAELRELLRKRAAGGR